MTTTTKNSKSFIAGLLTATAASLCCITPLLAFLAGASGLASSFSFIDPFRPYLIALTILIFAFAWYQKLKPQQQVICNCETDNKKSFLQSKLLLSIVTVVAAVLIAFPYYAKAIYPEVEQQQAVISGQSKIKQAAFKIKGMTCEGCTNHVNHEISRLKGVIRYQTSFEKANSIVTFDNGKISLDSIVAAINNTGYTVVSLSVNNN